MKKILYGICGIGNGHFFRQVPVIEHLLESNHQILFFAYGESLKLLTRYQNNPLVKIIEVSVPYFIGNKEGVDFVTSEKINSQFDYSINLKAFSQAQTWLGKPDLVISDYEPVCAQYGYAYLSPVVTIDQQSKFFTRSTPASINGFNCEDEIMRLHMFFPSAHRIACSFFKVVEKNNVTIVPPLYRKSIKEIVRNPLENQFIIYLSAQPGFKQSLKEVIDIVKGRKEEFHIFTKEVFTESLPENIFIYPHGSCEFDKLLSTCSGVISTAGHNLLGECMYLNIPVYAMPIDLYEQQLNAYMLSEFCYGLNSSIFSEVKLNEFIQKNSFYKENIRHSQILLKEDGTHKLLQLIDLYLK